MQFYNNYLNMLSIGIGKHNHYVFQMFSSILCFPAKCTQEIELLTSHGMHRVKVRIKFLLKNQLYVVLQLRCHNHSVSQTPGELIHKVIGKPQVCQQLSLQLSRAKQYRVSPARPQIRKLALSVPPAQPTSQS